MTLARRAAQRSARVLHERGQPGRGDVDLRDHLGPFDRGAGRAVEVGVVVVDVGRRELRVRPVDLT